MKLVQNEGGVFTIVYAIMGLTRHLHCRGHNAPARV